MASGIASALIFLKFYDGLFLYVWPVIFLLSILGCLIGTYTAPPTQWETLESFYRTVRPWGWWGPVKQRVMEQDPDFRPNQDARLDRFNVVLGIIAQCCLTVLPIYVVLGQVKSLGITVAILLPIVFILKRTWWNRLEN
jgi:hypothetical protein